ncbi:hypothetical protein NP493_1222g00053 [Ridgeia piscesae]|uniref:WD repeat-containing protein 54 beta-propeller domain-containing protein n=1 Tax=Ridgeia piscesae TaxID=27915 RepID=A0AAD9KDI8_RIDPI|nr:hypothetical protein NP493_1222g00053 [Ridgeia piscesae]
MYRKEKPLLLKGSTSALANNLSIEVNLEKGIISYATVHKSLVNLVSASLDGTSVNPRQIPCKEPSASQGFTMILQAKLVQMGARTILVMTSQKGIQMYDADSSTMLFWYALGDVTQAEPQVSFGRGICAVLSDYICVGNHKGEIIVLHIPARGSNITVSETLTGNSAAICDLASENEKMVSCDDLGTVIVWKVGDTCQQLLKINGPGYPCSAVSIWNDLIVAGYSSGHMRVFNASTGRLHIEIAAHARWITAIDIAKKVGEVISVAEDTFLHIWQLKPGPEPEIEHKFSDCVSDVQLQGASFISEDGRAFAVTGYDNNELMFYSVC